jgi:hypothetical protein
MSRKYTREGLASAIGSAAAYSNQYYYGTDTGLYYYSDGATWTITTFSEGRSVFNHSGVTLNNGATKLVMPANPDRKWLFFQNISNAHMHLGLGYIPTDAANESGITVPADAIVKLENFVVTDAIYVTCANADKKYVALEG